MEIRELVGKWIVADLAAVTLDQSGNDVFRVVGYDANTNWVIVDAGNQGWKGAARDCDIAEKCETYWYMRPEDIIGVL